MGSTDESTDWKDNVVREAPLGRDRDEPLVSDLDEPLGSDLDEPLGSDPDEPLGSGGSDLDEAQAEDHDEPLYWDLIIDEDYDESQFGNHHDPFGWDHYEPQVWGNVYPTYEPLEMAQGDEPLGNDDMEDNDSNDQRYFN